MGINITQSNQPDIHETGVPETSPVNQGITIISIKQQIVEALNDDRGIIKDNIIGALIPFYPDIGTEPGAIEKLTTLPEDRLRENLLKEVQKVINIADFGWNKEHMLKIDPEIFGFTLPIMNSVYRDPFFLSLRVDAQTHETTIEVKSAKGVLQGTIEQGKWIQCSEAQRA